MNRQLRDQWADALLSGEYKQTIGQLRRLEPGFHDRTSSESGSFPEVEARPAPKGHCCLGVLVEVCIREWPDKFRWLNEAGQFSEPDTVVYPDLVDADEHMWESTGGELQTSGELMLMGNLLGLHEQEETLIDMNDGGKDFTTIAAWIKTNVPVDDDPVFTA